MVAEVHQAGRLDSIRHTIQSIHLLRRPAPEIPPVIEENPHYDPLYRAITNLYGQVTFRQVPANEIVTEDLYFNILTSDLPPRSAVRNFISGSKPTRELGVEIHIDQGTPFTDVGDLQAPRDARLKLYSPNGNLLVESTQEFHEGVVSRDVDFKRPNSETGIYENALEPGKLKPETVVDTLAKVAGGLKQEFVDRQVHRAAELLTPRQRVLVQALEERMVRVRNTVLAEDSSFNHDFLIYGSPNKEGELGLLTVQFTAPSRTLLEKAWRSGTLFANIPVNWNYHGHEVHGTTHYHGVLPEDTKPFSYASIGQVNVFRVQRKEKVFVEHVSITVQQLDNRLNDWRNRNNVDNGVRRSFRRFLYERAKGEFDVNEPVVLVASSPLEISLTTKS